MDEDPDKCKVLHEVSSGDASLIAADANSPERGDFDTFGEVTASGDALPTSTVEVSPAPIAIHVEPDGDCGTAPSDLVVQSPSEDTASGIGLNIHSMDEDTTEIEVLLKDAVDTVVMREQNVLATNAEVLKENAGDMPHTEATDRDQSCDTDREAICTYGDKNDDKDDNGEDDDFGDFSGPPEAADQLPHVLPTGQMTNGPAPLTSLQGSPEDDQIDNDDNDDFGDFDQANFDEDSSEGFANFEAALPLATAPVACAPSEEIRPLSVAAFGETINKLFMAEDPVKVEGLLCNENSITDEDYAEFSASVQRDVAHCENVDDWPCVVFRYENSVTRKALLNALCVDETPLNFPRFAMDCLSKAFLQPVKQAGGASVNEGHHSRGMEPNSSAGAESGGQGGLSDAAKEVLNKIPDLSFMKAEVLTFPAVSQAPLGIDL